MATYLIRRLIQAIVTLLGVTTLVFFVVRISGDPSALLLPVQASEAQVEAVRHAFGLDQPLYVQYVSFLREAARGDLGLSIRQGEPALKLVLERLPATLELALAAFVFGIALALSIGIGIQVVPNRLVGDLALWLAFFRQAIPSFWFGLLLILVFSVSLGWLPSLGSGTWQHLVLPAATLGTFEVALYLRLLNAGFGEHLRQDYVRTARAKGLREVAVLVRHALPNVLLPIVTVAGINFGVLLSGTVITESVFSWPGVGRLVVQAVSQRDYPLVQAAILVISVIFVFVNFAVDLLYAAIDPRVKLR
jgi:ABC-type dipeptide/oligopeptide/nickel transport system permease component